MDTLPIGKVKSQLSELVSRINAHRERVIVTVRGHPSAVLLAVDDLERLEETLEILHDAHTLRRLASSNAELASGEAMTYAELDAAIRRRSSDQAFRAWPGGSDF